MSVSTSRKGSTTTVYKKDVDRKTREMLHPSSSMFAHREVCIGVMDFFTVDMVSCFMFVLVTMNLKSCEM